MLLPQSVLPDPLLSQLFRTAFSDAERFQAEWTCLAGILEGAEPTRIFFEHLPLLHRRLTAEQRDPLAELVRTQYRQTWARNKWSMHLLGKFLEAFEAVGIQTLLLKGAALLATHYANDTGARFMGDVDVCVRQADFGRAVSILQGMGWDSTCPAEAFDSRFTHALNFTDGKGNYVDLHAHVLHHSSENNIDDLFWDAAVAVNVGEQQTHVLNDADMVMHSAVHGLRWTAQPTVRWVPDSTTILRGGPLDWDRLRTLTRRLRVSLFVSAAFDYLISQELVDVPEDVMDALRSAHGTKREQNFFQLITRDTFSSFWQTVRLHWHVMTQQQNESTLMRKVVLFPSYLSHRMKAGDFANPMGLLSNWFITHLLSKFGRYERSATGQRLR
jgi:hypothetical protein